jgi:hypothetical protein
MPHTDDEFLPLPYFPWPVGASQQPWVNWGGFKA